MRVPLACGLVAVAVWYAFIAPMLADVQDATRRVSGAESEIQRIGSAAAARSAVERDVRELEAAIETLKPPGAEPLDVTMVLSQLQSAAADSSVQITAIKPHGEPVPRAGPGVSFELAIAGTFHDIGRFLGRVGSMPRVAAAKDVNLKSKMGQSGIGSVAGSLVIAVYEFPPPDAQPVVYDDGGRREPFASLVAPRTSVLVAGNARRGLAAVSLSDIVVRGVARQGSRMLAILEATGRQSFVVRPRDRLADAVVEDIEPSGVVFVQRDGRGEPAQVRKPLRPSTMEPQ